jgi:hypothetical protein
MEASNMKVTSVTKATKPPELTEPDKPLAEQKKGLTPTQREIVISGMKKYDKALKALSK